MGRQRTFEMRLIDGQWPRDIRGHHWINGTGKLLAWQHHSIFAPGVLQRLDLEPTSDGRLLWHLRDTEAYDVQAAQAHPERFEDGSAFNVLGGPLLNACNNSFFQIGERMFLTADFQRPWEIDPESMELATVVGSVQEWGGTSRLGMLSPFVTSTAHPFQDRIGGRIYSYTYKPHPRNGTSLSEFDYPMSITRWDGQGDLERWEVPGAGLSQYVHEIGGTRNFVLLLESSSFHVETGIALFGLNKLKPHKPVSNVFIIRKSDLTAENRVRGVPFKKVAIPMEAFHLLADYEDDGHHVDFWLTHGNGLDFLAANKADDVHYRTGEPFARWQLDRFIHADYSPIGWYRVDVEREALVEKRVMVEPERLWGAGVWSWDPRPSNPADSPLYMSWLGFDPSLVSRRLMELYGERPHRVLPPGQLPDQAYPAALTVVDWKTRATSQCYVYAPGTITLANQFIPRPGDEGGWVGVYLVSPKWKVEYWLFDAERIADGPVARIGHEELRAEKTIHHTWTPTAPKRTATYHRAIEDDLGEDWRHLPASYRVVVEEGLRRAAELDRRAK